MASQITLEFKTDKEAQAVAAFMKVASAQKQMEGQTKRANTTSRQQSAILGSLKSAAMGLVGGFVGAAGVTRATQAIVTEFKNAIAATRAFEDEMTGLLSLGSNMGSIAAVKDNVIGLSNALGISTKTIADAMFQIESNASSLDAAMQKGIFKGAVGLTKLTGTELPESITALTKAMLIYGNEISSVEQAQSKLALAADRGALTFSDLAVLFPDLASVAKGFGTTYDELLGTIVVATQLGGRNEKTFTGLRNVILRMGEAMDQGVASGSSLVEQLQSLQSASPEKLKEVFGAEAVSSALQLSQNAGRVAEEINNIADASERLVGDKLSERLKDAAYLMDQILDRFEQMQKTQDIISDSTGTTFGERRQAAKTALRGGVMQSRYLRPFAGAVAAIPAAFRGGEVDEGARMQVRKLLQEGDTASARAVAGRFGLDINRIAANTLGAQGAAQALSFGLGNKRVGGAITGGGGGMPIPPWANTPAPRTPSLEERLETAQERSRRLGLRADILEGRRAGTSGGPPSMFPNADTPLNKQIKFLNEQQRLVDMNIKKMQLEQMNARTATSNIDGGLS